MKIERVVFQCPCGGMHLRGATLDDAGNLCVQWAGAAVECCPIGAPLTVVRVHPHPAQ